MRDLSKSKLVALRQCRRRLWLEVHRPDLREDAPATKKSFQVGHTVGELAHSLFDPKNTAKLISIFEDGISNAFKKTKSALEDRKPIFEAGFRYRGAFAFVDVLLPVRRAGRKAWRLIEVKSTTEIKDYHRDDVAIQSYVTKGAGVDLESVSIAYINRDFSYSGDGIYSGLLIESDHTQQAERRRRDVIQWIREANEVLDQNNEPELATGHHCHVPFSCSFHGYCSSSEPRAKFPATVLPRVQTKALKALLEENPAIELSDIPNELLNAKQLRVKSHTLSGTPFFDLTAASLDLSVYPRPLYFMDFETVQFPIPIWKGTRPYQQVPFQFSVHKLTSRAFLHHTSFIDITGQDPSKRFAEALIRGCEESGTIFAYNAGFEKGRIRDLADRFPALKRSLYRIIDRTVDLLPFAERHYYHPMQDGSWSIKALLPAVAPDVSYTELDGVKDGGMAMEAYIEAIDPSTSDQRKSEIESQLLAYCKLDTFAMVRIWQKFTGSDVKLSAAG